MKRNKYNTRIDAVFEELYIFVYLFGVSFRPIRECFTHTETSPLPVKDCKF